MSMKGPVSNSHAQVGLARLAMHGEWRLAKVAPSRSFDCKVRFGGHVRSTALMQRSTADMRLLIRRIYVTHGMTWYERDLETRAFA